MLLPRTGDDTLSLLLSGKFLLSPASGTHQLLLLSHRYLLSLFGDDIRLLLKVTLFCYLSIVATMSSDQAIGTGGYYAVVVTEKSFQVAVLISGSCLRAAAGSIYILQYILTRGYEKRNIYI